VARQDTSSKAARKRPYDVYTVMLFISFIALLTGCLLLYSELNSYGSFPWFKPGS
jgi:hypothetical protein